MRILLLGDVVGAPGRLAIQQKAAELRQRLQLDLLIVNAENSANGSGLTPTGYHKLKEAGVDAVTLGDHAFRKKQIRPLLETAEDLVRPANWPAGAPGRGSAVVRAGDHMPPVHLTVVLGRLFMVSAQGDDPFAAADRFLDGLPDGAVSLVEMHAEATSEKIALGWHLSGRASCVYGTHTHVHTADARLLPAGVPGSGGPAGPPPLPHTAYVTDLGMTGAADSVLGRRVDRVVDFLTTARPSAFDVADDRPELHGVVVDIDNDTGRAKSIQRFDEPADVNQPPFV
ncbi:MAG: TIGR00282 family metallophosphoesterase [Planctomycetota bacterium]